MAGYMATKLWLLGLESRPPTSQSRTLYMLLELKISLVHDQIKSVAIYKGPNLLPP